MTFMPHSASLQEVLIFVSCLLLRTKLLKQTTPNYSGVFLVIGRLFSLSSFGPSACPPESVQLRDLKESGCADALSWFLAGGCKFQGGKGS